MRCVIARFPFELFSSDVLAAMKGVKPEPVTGDSVLIGRRRYPVKQVGAVITRQDRRDFTSGEVVRALTALGFACTEVSAAAAAEERLTPLQAASALMGSPTSAY